MRIGLQCFHNQPQGVFMNRHWLDSYPNGVAHEIDPEQFQSLNQLLEDSFKKNADSPFSVCMDRWMSYAQLDSLSSALGAWLQAPVSYTHLTLPTNREV